MSVLHRVGLKWRSSTRLILTTICLAIFTDGFLYAVIIPILPFALIDKSNVAPDNVQRWESYLLTVYGGAQFLFSPLTGWLADKTTSRRWPFMAGLLVQLLSVLLFLTAEPTVYILFVARLLGGISAAVVFSVGLALLQDTVGQKKFAQDAGLVFFSNNVGVLIGPTLGGLVYARSGYYPVVWMMCALVAADLILRLVMVEKQYAMKTKDTQSQEVDQSGPVQGSSNSSHDHERPADETYSSAEPSETAPLLDKRGERRGKKTGVPPLLRLLGSFRVLADCYAAFIGFVVLSSFDAALPMFVKTTFAWDAKGAGLIFLTIALPSLLSPVAGRLSNQFGPKWVMSGGLIAVGAGCISVQSIRRKETSHIVGLCVLMTIIGTGLAGVFPCVAEDLTLCANDLEGRKPGSMGKHGAFAQTFSLFNSAIAAGTVIGPLWMSYAVPNHSFAFATTISGLLALSAIVPILLFSAIPKAEDTAKNVVP